MFFITIKCDKDLVNSFGHKDFTKDKEYLLEGYEITEKAAVVSDDEGWIPFAAIGSKVAKDEYILYRLV